MSNPLLQLFYFAECPFCQDVMHKIDTLNLNVTLEDVKADSSRIDKIIKDLGKKTVPVLYINNKPMTESANIIKWLDENKDNLSKK